MSYWYLSFADDNRGGFLGACVVEGFDIVSATIRAHELGINPGGQVLGLPMPHEHEDDYPHDRLLKREEITDGVRLGDVLDDGKEQGR